MIKAPLNSIIVKVKTKYIGNMTDIMRLAHIQNNSSIQPANLVNIMGEVVSLPMSICDKREYDGFSIKDIQVGDMAIFSYLVIFNFCITKPEEDPIFKNRIWLKGEEYFLCDVRNLFATIRDTKIRMQNGYVMVEELEAPSKIILPQHIKKKLLAATGIISHIGKNLENKERIEAEVGDRVYFNPNKIQNYQISGKPFGILRQSDILGRKVLTYQEIAALN